MPPAVHLGKLRCDGGGVAGPAVARADRPADRAADGPGGHTGAGGGCDHGRSPSSLPALHLALLATALLLALAPACHLLDDTHVGAGSRVVVGLYDAESRVALELANETHPELRDAYSELRPSAHLKLAPEQALEELLERLEAAGFHRFAVPGTAPGSRTEESWLTELKRSGTRGAVHVARDGESLLFTVPAGTLDGGERLAAFIDMKFAVDALYQKASGLQLIDNPLGRDIFERQRGVEVRK